MPYLSDEEAIKLYHEKRAERDQTQTNARELAEAFEGASLSDLGDIPPVNWQENSEVGNALPVQKVREIYENYPTPVEAQADYELDTLPNTLNALSKSLKSKPIELKSLAEQSGLSYFAIDSDPEFARKKIDSDRYNESLAGFMANIDQNPHTAELLAALDPIQQLILTSDLALSIASREWREQERGFLESGYIGSAINAWDYGQFSREVVELGQKLMNDTATDEDWQRLVNMRKVQSYGAGLRHEQGLFERMVRGSVESVITPMAGGIGNAVDWTLRYGAQAALAGAGVGAAMGAAAGGIGAAPGAFMGAVRGVGTAALGGFVEDMARQEGTNVYLTLRMDMGVPNDIAKTLAYASGAAIGALEFTGMGMMARVFPGAGKFLTKGAVGAALGFARNNPAVQKALGPTVMRMLQGAAGEVATEVSQEIVAIGAESIGRNYATEFSQEPTWREILERLTDTGQQTLESIILPVGIGGAMSARSRRRAANQLQQVRDQELGLLDLYAQTAQESSTVQEMPETARNFLDAFAQDGAVPQNVYVSAQAIQETFFQEENADLMAAAAEMGITPESLQENLALGADVAIPFAKAATGIFADQERYNALREQMRLSPESLTSAQVQEAANIEQDAASRQAYLDTLLEPLYQRQQADEAVQERRAEIAKPYVEQLMQAGYIEEQAGKYGQVLAAHAEQMAPIKGQTPQEYLQEHFAGYRAMTQADFEAGNIGFFQEDEREYIREDFTRKNNEDTAKVITLENGVIPDLHVKELGNWIISLLEQQGGNVVINSTNQNVEAIS